MSEKKNLKTYREMTAGSRFTAGGRARSSRFGSARSRSGLGSRRLLALVCALMLVALQCFVVAPAITGQVYAEEDVNFLAYYKNGSSGQQSNSSWITSASGEKIKIEVDTGKKDPETGLPITEVKSFPGHQVSKVLEKAKLTDRKAVYIEGEEIKSPSSRYLVDLNGSWYLYKINKDGMGILCNEDPIGRIEVESKKDPIKITKAEASKKKPVKGEKVTINYTIEVDSFFRKSDGYSNDMLSLKWVASNNKVSLKSTETDDSIDEDSTKVKNSFTVTVKQAGEVSISPKTAYGSEFDYLNGSAEVSLTGEKVKLTATPSSVKLKVNEIKNITVKDDFGIVNSSELTWESSNSKVATVSGGVIRGIKKGKATVTVKSSASTSKGATAKISVKVSPQPTQHTTRYTGGGGYNYRPTNGTLSTYGRATGPTTAPTTATRPIMNTDETLAPSFQTITVKEVYLTPTTDSYSEDEVYYDEYGNPIEDEGWEDEGMDDESMDDEEDWDEDGVSVPAAAGSAAVAAAACGAGAVGRVRRFRIDMSDVVAGAVTGAAAAGSGDGDKEGGARGKLKFLRGRGADAGQAAGPKKGPDGTDGPGEDMADGKEKASRNPLKKIRRRS